MKTKFLLVLFAILAIDVQSQVQFIQFTGSASDFFIDAEPGSYILRTRNWNADNPNIGATGIHTGQGVFESNINVAGNANIGGYLGIGISIPTKPLDIISGSINGNYTSLLRVGTDGPAYGGSGGAIEFAAKNNNGNIDPVGVIAASLTGGSANYQTGDLRFLTSLNGQLVDRMLLTSAGLLDVFGTIRAREVKVCLNQGCDFVFDKSYKFLSIPELDSFIKLNKHLPDIAPASKMENEGINLSEMNVKLLQKIEEQSLYIIELNKRLSELEKQMKELKK